jgi:DNA-binding response OmpR family regulator
MPRRILLVDDDALLRRSLAFNLERNHFEVQTAASGEDALEVARQSRPDLVILDIGLPGMDGLETLRVLRDERGLPVILLTARRRELDEVLGLELGADDYVTKPFDLDVLLARIRAVLRRSQPASAASEAERKVAAGDLVIDPEANTAVLAGRLVDLAPREFDLLYALIRRAGKLVTTDELLAQVWGAEFEGQPQVVYVHIRWLRTKIEADPLHPRRLLTIRGRGYKYQPQEAA